MIGDPASAPESAPEDAAPPGEAAGGAKPDALPPEIGGRDGPEPTRFGDWEKNGRCIDF